MIEIWRDVKGFKDYYMVSNYGRVRSLRNDKILKPIVNYKGYLLVQLSLNGYKKNKRIHRLVAEAFIPNPDSLQEVDHIDNNRQNNFADNLRWATGSENTRNRDVCRQSTSKYNGVSQDKRTGRFIAHVRFNKKTTYLGSFSEDTKAALAFNKFCIKNRLNRELNVIKEV